jgi:uncharacterized protein YraI
MEVWSVGRIIVCTTVVGLGIGVCLSRSPSAMAESTSKSATEGRLLCVHGVSGNSLNVRAGPGLDKPIVATLRRDDCGLSQAGRCESGWCEMARGDVRGWIDTRYIGVYETPERTSGKSARVTPQRAAVRKRPKGRSLAASAPATRGKATPEFIREPEPHRGYGLFGGLFRLAMGAAFPIPPQTRNSDGACVVGVMAWDTLRIRRGPGVSHAPIGAIPSDACRVRELGDCSGAWCRVAWSDQVGWVNTLYLR